MQQILNTPFVTRASDSPEFEGHSFMLTVSECDHCKTLLLESNMIGIFEFITQKIEIKDSPANFMMKKYLILENGMAIDQKVTFGRMIHYGMLEFNVNGNYEDPPALLFQRANCDYLSLYDLIQTHESFIGEMRQNVKSIEGSNCYIQQLEPEQENENEFLEGMMIKKELIPIIDKHDTKYIEIISYEQRYVRFKNKFCYTTVYFLKHHHLTAVKSPAFITSDVYLLTHHQFSQIVI